MMLLLNYPILPNFLMQKNTNVIFCDLQKAFDTWDHKTL